MDYRKIDYYIFYILLSLSTVILVYVSLFSSVHYEGSESIYHYFHSEAIGKHPEVALNHWGKPLFIALSAPFTYFGEKGVMIFNSLAMLLSAFYSFKFGRKLGFVFAFPLAIFVIFSPVYFKFSQSCLTEPLFGLVAISSAYFFICNRYFLSTILISFIIFSRSEGMLFIPLYLIALVIKKEYKVVPFLVFGFIFYGIIGLMVNKEFLWYYYDYPYSSSAVEIYGTGPFWHWFTNQRLITGTPFSLFIATSFVFILIKFLLKTYRSLLTYTIPLVVGIIVTFINTKMIFAVGLGFIYIVLKDLKHKNLVFLGLIVIPATVYIFGHSYLWYKGLSASIGLFRIVGGVIPLLAVIGMYGLDSVVKRLINYKRVRVALVCMFLACFSMLWFTFEGKKSVILVQPNELEKTILRSIKWLDEHDYGDRKMFVYQAHYISHYNGDHFDKYNTNVINGVDNRVSPHDQLNVNDLLIYDSKFSPLEGGLFLENIDTTYMKSRQIFYPENEFMVHGGRKYLIQIFERVH